MSILFDRLSKVFLHSAPSPHSPFCATHTHGHTHTHRDTWKLTSVKHTHTLKVKTSHIHAHNHALALTHTQTHALSLSLMGFHYCTQSQPRRQLHPGAVDLNIILLIKGPASRAAAAPAPASALSHTRWQPFVRPRCSPPRSVSSHALAI